MSRRGGPTAGRGGGICFFEEQQKVYNRILVVGGILRAPAGERIRFQVSFFNRRRDQPVRIVAHDFRVQLPAAIRPWIDAREWFTVPA